MSKDTHRIVTDCNDVIFITRYDRDDIRVVVISTNDAGGDKSIEVDLTEADIRRISEAIHDHE